MGRNICRPISAGSPAFSSEVPGLRAQSARCCKGDYMAIQTTKPANPLRQHGKEQDGACPVSSNNFWFLWFLSWLAKICLRQPFSGARIPARKYFGGPEKCDQTHPRPQTEQKYAKSGAAKFRRPASFLSEARASLSHTNVVKLKLVKSSW